MTRASFGSLAVGDSFYFEDSPFLYVKMYPDTDIYMEMNAVRLEDGAKIFVPAEVSVFKV